MTEMSDDQAAAVVRLIETLRDEIRALREENALLRRELAADDARRIELRERFGDG